MLRKSESGNPNLTQIGERKKTEEGDGGEPRERYRKLFYFKFNFITCTSHIDYVSNIYYFNC